MLIEKNLEVTQAIGSIIQIAKNDVEQIIANAMKSEKRRSRLCAHPDSSDRLHEMLICLSKGTYIRPHRHGNKSESFHIIHGELDILLFDENGNVSQKILMGEYSSEKSFYYRIMAPMYHSVIVRSEYVLFHEVTNGPFNREDTEYAPWAPEENGNDANHYYLKLLNY